MIKKEHSIKSAAAAWDAIYTEQGFITNCMKSAAKLLATEKREGFFLLLIVPVCTGEH